jgi:PilZ domain-containing protein
MSIEKRRHIRFSLDIPAIRCTKYGEAFEIMLHQISIGGCLAEWDESVLVGEEFRLLLPLPNQNRLPLACKALYRFADNGIGVKFLNITQFEQELISKIISGNLETQGLPMQVDPFGVPHTYGKKAAPRVTDYRLEKDEILDDILSIED